MRSRPNWTPRCVGGSAIGNISILALRSCVLEIPSSAVRQAPGADIEHAALIIAGLGRPTILTTGFSAMTQRPAEFKDMPTIAKPVDRKQLVQVLSSLLETI